MSIDNNKTSETPINEMSYQELRKEVETLRHRERTHSIENSLLQNETIRRHLTPTPAIARLRAFYILNSAIQNGKLATQGQFFKSLKIFEASDKLRYYTNNENRIQETITEYYTEINSKKAKKDRDYKEQQTRALIEFINSEKNKLYQEVGWMNQDGTTKKNFQKTEFSKELTKLKQFMEKTSLPVLKAEMQKKYAPELVKAEKSWWQSLKEGFKSTRKSLWQIFKWGTSPVWAPIWLAAKGTKLAWKGIGLIPIVGKTIQAATVLGLSITALGPLAPTIFSSLGLTGTTAKVIASLLSGAGQVGRSLLSGATAFVTSGLSPVLQSQALSSGIAAKVINIYKTLYGGLYSMGSNTVQNVISAFKSGGLLPSLTKLGEGAHEGLAFIYHWLKDKIYAPLISGGAGLVKKIPGLIK